jgi:hypothetical protein
MGLNDACCRPFAIFAKCTTEKSTSQNHFLTSQAEHTFAPVLVGATNPISSAMEVLSEILNMAVSILTIIAALIALARDFVQRRQQSHQ